jgi:hypothetical protein
MVRESEGERWKLDKQPSKETKGEIVCRVKRSCTNDMVNSSYKVRFMIVSIAVHNK